MSCKLAHPKVQSSLQSTVHRVQTSSGHVTIAPTVPPTPPANTPWSPSLPHPHGTLPAVTPPSHSPSHVCHSLRTLPTLPTPDSRLRFPTFHRPPQCPFDTHPLTHVSNSPPPSHTPPVIPHTAPNTTHPHLSHPPHIEPLTCQMYKQHQRHGAALAHFWAFAGRHFTWLEAIQQRLRHMSKWQFGGTGDTIFALSCHG